MQASVVCDKMCKQVRPKMIALARMNHCAVLDLYRSDSPRVYICRHPPVASLKLCTSRPTFIGDERPNVPARRTTTGHTATANHFSIRVEHDDGRRGRRAAATHPSWVHAYRWATRPLLGW